MVFFPALFLFPWLLLFIPLFLVSAITVYSNVHVTALGCNEGNLLEWQREWRPWLPSWGNRQSCGEKSQRKPLQSLGTQRHRARPLYLGRRSMRASCRKGLLLVPFACWSWVFCSQMLVARLQHPTLNVVSAGSCGWGKATAPVQA